MVVCPASHVTLLLQSIKDKELSESDFECLRCMLAPHESVSWWLERSVTK